MGVSDITESSKRSFCGVVKAGVLGLTVVNAGLRSGGAVYCLTRDGLKTLFSGARGKLCCRKGLPFLGAPCCLNGFAPKLAKDGAAELWEALGGVSLSVQEVRRG